MFEVSNNVSLEDKNHRGRLPRTTLKFPWASMEVGDSFFVPASLHNNDIVRLMNKITASGRSHFGNGHVKARSRVEGGILGVRVWRVA